VRKNWHDCWSRWLKDISEDVIVELPPGTPEEPSFLSDWRAFFDNLAADSEDEDRQEARNTAQTG
jgi:hypothetical protein